MEIEVKEYLYYCAELNELFMSNSSPCDLNLKEFKELIHQGLGVELYYHIFYIGVV